ncbi:MAG: ACP S-malonyltransferase [Actinobacteria bacterium]|nr:ACP S-malonyltransferase [Actinomycetota bacterium]
MRPAFLFPGQGSQRPAMASAWRGTPQERVFTEVGHAAGMDLRALADDADRCGASTAVAQPAILAASLAAFDALTAAGVRPAVVAGHSLGEVTAAVAAEALSPADGALLVAERGRAMGAACAASPGSMAAVVRLDDDALETLLRRVPAVAVANVNAPGQAVLAGPPAAIERAGAAARELGGRLLPLDVEGAFHSAAMTSAVVRVDAVLRRLPVHDPTVTFLSGATAAALRTAGEVTRALVDGILAPVRWREVQEQLPGLGVDLLVEVGPGGVLGGLARRTVPGIPVLSVEGPGDVAEVVDALAGADARALPAEV